MIEIPKERRKPLSNNPATMIIYSAPKMGKTTITAALENSLILEAEPNGANFVEGRIMQINKASEFNETLKAIKESEGLVAEYLIIDTITKLDEWSEILGTYDYMNKTQGKNWNLKDDKNPKLGKFSHLDKEFETVHELGQGFGYRYSREVMVNWYDRIVELISLGKVKYVIFIAHIKDKLIELKTGEYIESSDLNLTGKVKSIFTSRVDAIGHLYRKGKKGYLNFNNEHKVISGGRCNHLNEEILISEKQEDGTIKTFWDKVYLK